MSKKSKVLIALLIIFILIQFIRPAKNEADKPSLNDISIKYNVPLNVKNTLKASCYDCHSNNTVYPWYAELQPVGWWLSNHVNEGKRGLNFSEFSAYPIRKQYHKLEDIIDLVKKEEMPLKSYLIIHTYARLDDQQKLSLVNWSNSLRDNIKANYPPDSLVKTKN